ncbi:GTP cyclohydrolase I [Streptomyces sp. NPDC051133]|uniref:GTP cyclohydrolase I n=1 Tax=Streptomyces sp. NPDC051133 TaxID=3155521 RepID=UPI00341D34E6
MSDRPYRTTARTERHYEEETEPGRPALRVVHEPDGVDLAAAEAAAGQFLTALGISTPSESLRGTPGRMARAYAELDIEAEHCCMTLRGVQATGSSTMTSSLLGLLRSDARSRSEFLALTGAAG